MQRKLPPSAAGTQDAVAISGGAWYCIRVHRCKEDDAYTNLVQQGYRIFLPKHITPRKSGLILEPLFPQYMFAHFDVETDRWKPICSTLGVRNILGHNPYYPTPIPDWFINFLLRKVDKTGIMVTSRARETSEQLTVGDKVKVSGTANPLIVNMEGVIVASNSKRIQLLLDIMGHAVNVSVPLKEVTKV